MCRALAYDLASGRITCQIQHQRQRHLVWSFSVDLILAAVSAGRMEWHFSPITPPLITSGHVLAIKRCLHTRDINMILRFYSLPYQT